MYIYLFIYLLKQEKRRRKWPHTSLMPTKYQPNIPLAGTMLSSSEHRDKHKKMMWHRLLTQLFSSDKLHFKHVKYKSTSVSLIVGLLHISCCRNCFSREMDSGLQDTIYSVLQYSWSGDKPLTEYFHCFIHTWINHQNGKCSPPEFNRR